MLGDQIKADLTVAMKAGDPLKLSVLRMLSSEMSYKQIDLQHDLTEEDVVAVVQKEAKKRREAIDAYGKANRPDSVAKEQQELNILSKYLPVLLTEDEVRSQIAAMPELANVMCFSDAMRLVSPVFKGKADGGMVARIVKERFSA